MTHSAEIDAVHGDRERIQRRLAKVRRSSIHGDLIAGPEVGADWLASLAEEVRQMLTEQEDYHLAMHRAYRPEIAAEIAVRLDEESDWEATAQWCGGTIHGSQDPSGEWTSYIDIPGVGSASQGAWITLDHAGQFRIRAEVAGPETTVNPPGNGCDLLPSDGDETCLTHGVGLDRACDYCRSVGWPETRVTPPASTQGDES